MGMSTTRGGPEINVTPLIDVLLVLLIIFLVMIPIMARLETVELPPKAPPDTTADRNPVTIKLHGDLSISFDDGPPQLSSELPQIRSKLSGPLDKMVFVDADSTVPWAEVTSIVDRIRGLGDTPESIKVLVRIHDPVE